MAGAGPGRLASRVRAPNVPRSGRGRPPHAGREPGKLCRFCYAAQRALLWGLGMSEARIERLEQELSASLAPRTAAAIAFGRSQSRMGRAGAWDARQALRRAGFS